MGDLSSEFVFVDSVQIYSHPDKVDELLSIQKKSGNNRDSYLLSSLEKAQDLSDGSNELLGVIKDWYSYYHLGLGRSNILHAVELHPQQKVLEIGAGCGAITRYLGECCRSVDCIEEDPLRARIVRERCRDLNNVRVFYSDFDNFPDGDGYDVVISMGLMEYGKEFLSRRTSYKNSCDDFFARVKKILNKDGIFIFAVDNELGLQFCFGFKNTLYPPGWGDALMRYPLSKKEIIGLLQKAGFSFYSFLSCFPDYAFTSCVFNDHVKTSEFFIHNWIDIPFPGTSRKCESLPHEGLLLKSLSEEDLLQDFANSFCIVAGIDSDRGGGSSEWIVKRISVNRRGELRCVTTLRNKTEPYVEKRRINGQEGNIEFHVNGDQFTHQIYDRKWEKGNLLIFDLYRILYTDQNQENIERLYKKYYDILLRSCASGSFDAEGYPLMRGNSLDFIFRNLIVTDSDVIFIDDALVYNALIPADLIVFRCIRHDLLRQIPWMKKHISDTEEFSYQLLQKLFPQYSDTRNQRNHEFVGKIHQLVTEGVPQEFLDLTFSLKKGGIVQYFIYRCWGLIPRGIKYKIRRWIS